MQTKLLTNRIPYTFIRGGYYYFSRRVPADLQSDDLQAFRQAGLKEETPAFDSPPKPTANLSLSDKFKTARTPHEWS